MYCVSFIPMKEGVAKELLCNCLFHLLSIIGSRWMLIVSLTLPRLIWTVPLLLTWVMVKGPFVGTLIFGWLCRSSASNTMSTWSPGAYCLSNRDLFSLWFEAAKRRWRSWWIADQLIYTARRKIISWLKAKWQGECLMLWLMVVLTAHATASKALCMSWNLSALL